MMQTLRCVRKSQQIRLTNIFQPQRCLHNPSTPHFLPRSNKPVQLQQRLSRTNTLQRGLRQIRNNSSKPSPDVTSHLGSPEPKIGLKDKLKQLFKQYGWLSVGVYFAFSALDFPFCFLAVRLAGPERIGQIEHQVLSSLKGYTEPVWRYIEPVAGPAVHAVSDAFAKMRQGAVNTAGMGSEGQEEGVTSTHPEAASIWTQLALAYGIHKTLLIFVRVPLTAAFTPRIARALRKRGWKIGSSSSTRR